MSGKRLLTLSLLLPFLAISTLANAGPRITDKSYWPDAYRPQPAQTAEGAVIRHARPKARIERIYVRTPTRTTVGTAPR
jgi:hypothetical protein